MDRSRALTIFNIPYDATSEEIEEHIENEAFSIYSPLFTQDPVPSLVKAKIIKLKQLSDALAVLTARPDTVYTKDLKVISSGNPLTKLQEYQQNLARLRSALSQSYPVDDKISILAHMVEVRISWDRFWAQISEPLNEFHKLLPEVDKKVKLSENVDVLKMMQILAAVEEGQHFDFNKVKLSDSQREVLVMERLRSIRILSNANLNE